MMAARENANITSSGMRFFRGFGGVFITLRAIASRRASISSSVNSGWLLGLSTMKQTPLNGPKLKLERAKRHIRDTETAVRDFIAGNPYDIFEEVDLKTGEQHVKVRLSDAPIPGDIGLTAADAIHNMRVSLDQLACSLAAQHGFPDSRSTYFPFGRSRDHFETDAIKKKIKRLSPAAQAMVALQKPYRGGDDMLWSLHALDLMDKHQKLVPVYSTGSGVAFFGLTKKPIKLIANPTWSVAENDMTIAIFPPGTYPEGNFKISFNVAFGEVGPVEGKPIVAVLNVLAARVDKILGKFEKGFF